MPKNSKSPTPPTAVLQPENAVCEGTDCTEVENGVLSVGDAEWLVEFGHIEFPSRHFAYSCSECLVNTIALALGILGNEIEPSPYEPYSVRVAAYTPGQPILPKPLLSEPAEEN